MLSINGLHNFYYLPELHDMRCKAQRIAEIIRGRYHRNPLNGDVTHSMVMCTCSCREGGGTSGKNSRTGKDECQAK